MKGRVIWECSFCGRNNLTRTYTLHVRYCPMGEWLWRNLIEHGLEGA